MQTERDQGFTLIEVLVAFIIAIAALAVLARAGLDGVRSTTVAARYQEALTRAQSHLAAVGDALQPSDRQGDEGDGFHWHVRIAPVASEVLAATGAPKAGPSPRLSLMAVSVAISWGEGSRRTVELDSERVADGAAGSAP
jgi:general secretion pathway protein I